MRTTGLKKIKYFGIEERTKLIDKEQSTYSIRQQCQLLGLSRSTLYYEPTLISARDQILMNLLDEQYTRLPFYGVRKMTRYLQECGYAVGKDHVRTLLRLMGLQAIFPKKNLSLPHPQHTIYPYLLREVEIARPNQVWSADITYIRLTEGFAYLTAVIDWHSRAVLSWRLSNTLDTNFCVEALQEALFKGSSPFQVDESDSFGSIHVRTLSRRYS